MDIAPHELLRAIRLPRTTEPLRHYYRKVGTRKAQAISKVCFAGVARTLENRIAKARIALGSVAPVPIRCHRTEQALENKLLTNELIEDALQTLTAEIAPIDDVRSTKNYRLRVSLNLLQDFLLELKASS